MGSIHFDTGIGYVRKAKTTPEGYLQAEVVFAKDGILEYQTPRGVRKELRLPEENKRALDDFCLKPLTVEHPPLLINAQNAKDYTVGLTDSTAYYDKNTGFVRGVITVFDAKAVDLIKSGQKQEVSVGYECEVEHKPGEYQGQRYDAIQKNLRINHVCVTERGRAGPDVKVLHLDSTDSDVAISINHKQDSYVNMVSVTRNGVEYTDIPDSFATMAAQEFSRLDALVQEYRTLESSTAHLDSVTALETERDRLQGRCDHYEMILKPALSILDESNIHWDDESSEFYSTEEEHEDSVKAKSDIEDMSDDEEMDEEEETEEGEDPFVSRFKKKKDSGRSTKKKMDEDDEPDGYDDEDLEAMGYEKKDSAVELMRAWKEVDVIIPDFSSSHYDSIDSVAGIQRLALKELNPRFDTASRSDAEIAGAYLAMLEDQQDHSRNDGANQLEQMIAQTSLTYGRNRQDSVSDPRMDAWKQPLSMTRQ
jgi:hypothetical protein